MLFILECAYFQLNSKIRSNDNNYYIWTKIYVVKYIIFRAAFFEGQIEQPVRGLTSLMTHQDIPVLVAINARGVYVIDDLECVSLYNISYH